MSDTPRQVAEAFVREHESFDVQVVEQVLIAAVEIVDRTPGRSVYDIAAACALCGMMLALEAS